MADVKDITNMSPEKDMTVFSNETKTDPFGHNVSSARAYARAERIAAAIYLLTRSVPESESLKALARDRSHTLIQLVLKLKDGFRNVQNESVRDVEACVREMVSVMRLLALSGYVSPQNADITIDALDDLVVFLKNAQHSLLAEKLVLSKGDFMPHEREESPSPVGNRAPTVAPKPKSQTERRQGVAHPAQPRATSPERGHQHGSRREAILALLKESGPLGIKDIASHITGCSEKTVQRELVALVGEDRVSKSGEKRWSRYAFKA